MHMVELQMNNTTGNKLLGLHNNEPCVDVESTQPLANEGKITPKLKDNIIFAQHVSFVVVMSIIFVGPFFDMWIEPSLMKFQHGQAWASALRLLGFMVFVLAVATMILVGVPFVGMQTFVLTFWAIWMHLKS
ncbi:hypothetical protein A2U01_0008519 [Trifolium medium]|uniref:Uncharacterized protein n=1 Tax=Trifolium medium TaxID=97028 RepID=A0A392MJH2_9FABA|nr:hypothetical protein [Trifolium medium]